MSKRAQRGVLLPTPTNVEEKSIDKEVSSTELVHNEQFEDTPIWVRGSEETGYFGTLGMSIITEKYKTIEEVEALLAVRDWNAILTVVNVYVQELMKDYIKRESERLGAMLDQLEVNIKESTER